VLTVKAFIWPTCDVRIANYVANITVPLTPLDSASNTMEFASNTMEKASTTTSRSRSSDLPGLESVFKMLNTSNTPNITISYKILSDCPADDTTVNTLRAAVDDGSFNRELKKNYKGSVKVEKGLFVYIPEPVRDPLQPAPAAPPKAAGTYVQSCILFYFLNFVQEFCFEFYFSYYFDYCLKCHFIHYEYIFALESIELSRYSTFV
jgi:hypothetical protein